MADSHTPSNRLSKERERLENANIDDRDRDAIESMLDALDKETSTREAYCRSMRLLASRADETLAELTVNELTAEIDAQAEARDWSDDTISLYQSALKAFVRHVEGEDAADDVDIKTRKSKPSVDPRTVLSPADVHEIRDHAANMRDRAMIDLFAYTGQRLRVVQALKIRDVDVEEGVYYMPEDVEGLKGADETGKKRPLLAARRSVADWLDLHPTGNPDDALLTVMRDGRGTTGEELSPSQIRRRLEKTAEWADVEKPTNPHAFRHHFVTIAKTQYGMDNETIKHLIGHSQGSKIMETTYAHLSDDDHIAAARDALGIDDGEESRESFTPPVCPTCGVPLRDGIETCPTPTCNERFSPESDAEDGDLDMDAILPYLGQLDDAELGEAVRGIVAKKSDA